MCAALLLLRRGAPWRPVAPHGSPRASTPQVRTLEPPYEVLTELVAALPTSLASGDFRALVDAQAARLAAVEAAVAAEQHVGVLVHRPSLHPYTPSPSLHRPSLHRSAPPLTPPLCSTLQGACCTLSRRLHPCLAVCRNACTASSAT